MSHLVIERYIYDIMNAQASMKAASSDARRQLAETIIRDINLYFADHMQDVREARDRLVTREDSDGRDMFAYVEQLLISFDKADRVARAAIERAGRS